MEARLVLLLGVACCCACASDTDCSAEGCIDGVEVQFEAPLTAPELFVAVLWDGNDVRCEVTATHDTCGNQGVDVDDSGGSVYGFRLPGQHPAKVTFSFSDINNDLVSVTVAPKYATQRPNGQDCPPVCRNGRVKL